MECISDWRYPISLQPEKWTNESETKKEKFEWILQSDHC